MLSWCFSGIVSLKTAISSLFSISTGKGIVVATAITNGIFDILLPILLASILMIVIVLIYKKIIKVPRWLSGGIIALKAIFLNSGTDYVIDYETLDKAIEASGYAYDPMQDMFYSIMNAWQRDFGYCRLYDEAAAPMGMIIDCEPIYFEYGGKRWLIEFWKGQYDLTTGCEVGVYTTEGPDLNIPGVFNGTFYYSAKDEDHLYISYSLKKNGEILFRRKSKHWWLTGFKLGKFSEPSELSMDISITLKDGIMRNAFVKGLKKAGYSNGEIIQNGKTVRLIFSDTHVPQPYTRTRLTDRIIQWKNKKMCDKYQDITADYKTMHDKVEAIQQQAPKLLRVFMNFGKTEKMVKGFKGIKDYLD